MAYTVFISHASRDRWVAGQIGREVAARGAKYFLDSEALESGDVVDEELRDALAEADELVVLLTPAALERSYVWVEIGAAWIQGLRIVGILYGLTTAELASRENTPAFVKGVLLRDINDFERYAEELETRLEEHDENG